MSASNVRLAELTRYRAGRVREQLSQRDYAGALLYDPINVRFATGSRNMQVWCLHNAVRYCLVLTDGPSIMFEFPGARHLLGHPEALVDEVREPKIFAYMLAADRSDEFTREWAAEIADILKLHGGGNRRLAVDHVDPLGGAALERVGLKMEDGQEVMERARMIKSADEIAAMRESIRVCEAAMADMRSKLEPGISEQELWSYLHQSAIANGSEWFETRLLSSGPRTNPWYQECSDRTIESGDLVAFDTDLVGCHGYLADISRTWLCGPRAPSDKQRKLYSVAYEYLERCIGLLKPGISYQEFSECCGPYPEPYDERRYTVLCHGAGLTDEYPFVPFQQDLQKWGTEGVLQENMTVCLESYAGEVGGEMGVKLEEQILITPDGIERLSSYPFEEEWL